ncbi:MAG TPA: GAF domain-containing protein [Gemmatimonadales bacterium]|nr:GAF domain-containing protein [Gemmatimonadales bacterium]
MPGAGTLTSTPQGRRISTAERYTVAVLAAIAAVVLHAELHRRFGESVDPLFLLVVAFSAWYGGFGAGVLTLVLLGLGALLTTVPPTGTFRVASGLDAMKLTMYGVTGLLMSGFIASLLEARRRAERETARTAQLHALNVALAPALKSQEAAALIIQHAMQALNARAGAIAYRPRGEPAAPATRSPGHPGDPDDPSGPLAQAMASGQAVFVESAGEWRERYPAAAVRVLHRGSVVAVPFMAEGHPAGGLELEFDHDRRMAPEDRDFVVTLAGQGAQALERARLYEAEQRARRNAEAAREQVAFLAEVSEVLASSLDYKATLAAAARLSVPRLADWCAVDILDTDGRLRRLAIAHTDPTKVDEVWAMSHRYAEAPEDPVPQVIRTARPQLIPDIPDDLLRRFARSEEHLQALRAFGLRSLLIVPLIARGRTLGAITFVLAESGRRFATADLLLGEDLARRAATAVDNARLYQETQHALEDKDRSLALLDTVFRGVPVGLAFVDRDLRFVRVNDALAMMNRTAVEDHIGCTLAEVLGEDAALSAPLFEEVFRRGEPVLDHEMTVAARSEEEGPRIYMTSYYPVTAPHGGTEWVGCMVSDVTEHRRAAELLVQAERMEAVARVAGGVAHEVNNMMTVITGFSGFLEGSLAADDARAEDVAEIRRAADRAAGITRQLLAYSRQQLLQPTSLDLNAVVQQSVPVLSRLLGPGIHVEVRPSADLVRVRADRAQLEQVLVNLALNARDAMSGHGMFVVTTENVMVEAQQRPYPPGIRMPEGRYVRLTVTDTGQGMDAATRGRIFEPFFTTKAAGQGSGLGLATVFGIVKQSGGYIWAYSEVGHGTAFKVYLPEFTGPSPEVPPTQPPTSPRGAETVLIVEDEVAVRRMAARTLSALGYTILEAENGAKALEVLASAPGEVNLVLTDVVMPVLNGRELGERLAEERPHLPVLFMSGYTDDDVIRRGLLRPGSPFLQKPFMPADLSRKVRDVLDRR